MMSLGVGVEAWKVRRTALQQAPSVSGLGWVSTNQGPRYWKLPRKKGPTPDLVHAPHQTFFPIDTFFSTAFSSRETAFARSIIPNTRHSANTSWITQRSKTGALKTYLVLLPAVFHQLFSSYVHW